MSIKGMVILTVGALHEAPVSALCDQQRRGRQTQWSVGGIETAGSVVLPAVS